MSIFLSKCGVSLLPDPQGAAHAKYTQVGRASHLKDRTHICRASGGTVRGNVDSLVKVVDALNRAGIELLGDHAPSSGSGRGVRLKEAAEYVRRKKAGLLSTVQSTVTA